MTISTWILKQPLTQTGVSLHNLHLIFLLHAILHSTYLTFSLSIHTFSFFSLFSLITVFHVSVLLSHLVVCCFDLFTSSSFPFISSNPTSNAISLSVLLFSGHSLFFSFVVAEEGPRTETFYKKACYILRLHAHYRKS